jgi:hypothetical protein
VVAASNTNGAVGNGTKPFGGSCAAPPCPSGSTVPIANSTSLKSTFVMSLAPDLLASFADARRAPKIPTFDIVNSLFHTAVLRIPSINALEGDLKESNFQKLIGREPTPDVTERRYRSSVIVGISKTPPSTNGSATGSSGTCSGTDRMLYWPSCFSGCWPSISFSCSSIGGLVVAADPRTLLIPSGISASSLLA